MGYLTTEVFQKSIKIPQLDQEGLHAYSKAWRKVLAHPEVGLIPIDGIKATDLLIACRPTRIQASSAFAAVARLEASKLNPDFTGRWKNLFQGTEEEVQLKIGALKRDARPVVQELITRQFFPDLYRITYGLNFWPIGLDGAFVAALEN